MKLAIYTHNLADLGGIERVVREHLRIFAARGVECKVFGEVNCEIALPVDGKERNAKLKEFLLEFKPDYVILHGVAHPAAKDDIRLAKELGIKTIVVCHFSFPSAMLLDRDELANRNFFEGVRGADMIATVSRIDAQWWRALGCRAMHVQNPFVHPKNSEVERWPGKDGTTNILWVGRNAEQKQPGVALSVFARLTERIPSVHLTMVGGTDKEWDPIRKKAKMFGLADKITCLGQRDDLNELWDSADLHLLTSVTESFCLVLAEAKAKGIPTAMFEIHFLELTKSKKGLILASQGDVEGLADKIAAVLLDKAALEQLGKEAKESLTPFNDEAVWKGWQKIFAALESGEGGYEVSDDLKTIVTQQFFAWNRFCDKHLGLIQKKYLLRRIVARLKRWLHIG